MTNAITIDDYVHTQLPAARPPNRANSPILPAGLTDESVVIQWLKAKSTGDGQLSETTRAQYVVEIRRLFWYARYIGKPVSEWTLDETGDYLAFLRKPDEDAVCTLRVPRGDPQWRPFRGPLSPASARQSQLIAGSFFKWLVDMQYLHANPFKGYGLAGKSARKRKKQTRFVGTEGLDLARRAIDARACRSDRERAKQARDRFVLALFTKTGLRTTEAIDAVMGSIFYARLSPTQRAKQPDAPEGVWLLDVEHGKGDVARTVGCGAVMDELQGYRVAYGLPPLPSPGEHTPLILGARRRTPTIGIAATSRQLRSLREDLGAYEGITNRSSLYRLVKGIFREALEFWVDEDPVEADRLERASTHWLRHSFAKGLIDHGADVLTVSRNLGHADVNTTMVYIDDEEIERAQKTGRFLGIA
ncbi:tyrosine-type recombinase/integrase [Paraburkholderia megapolitana]|uniref:tyrosine-type recombinase/integrase n=1 Tax=Paraburkholderia megapolitana TaxID=420953 RepID=UPI0038BBF756